VSFSVRFALSHDVTDREGINLGDQQTLVFDQAVTNVGQAYSLTTGIFTAPAAGTYAFFLTQMASNAHESIYLVIVKNGAILDMIFAQVTHVA
jgi:hypothetical protein